MAFTLTAAKQFYMEPALPAQPERIIQMPKKIMLLLLTALLFAGCSSQQAPSSEKSQTEKPLTIVATLFPQYDFARAIAGDHAEVTLLLPAGVESHSFEPTPSDIMKINQADLFVYTGSNMEPWAETMIQSLDNPNLTVVDVSQNVPMDPSEDEHHPYDPHIWTSPVNAKIMVENVAKALCEKDPDNAASYQKNADEYTAELDALDQQIRQTIANGKRNEIIFGGRFAFHYFIKEYGLDYRSAYDNCSEETEPSVKTIASLIDEINQKQIPVIYYEELTDPKIARSISEATGAELLLFHSCHNVSKEDYENGATYLSLMKQNLENLKKGLN